MMSRARALARLGLLAVAVFTLGIGCMPPAAQARPRTSTAHVYLLSGLLSMSPGFDGLADIIRRHGIPASVANHTLWSEFASDAIAQYKQGRLRSIVIIGHSAGGGAALDMAAELEDAGVPVALLIAIDPTGTSEVPANVRHTVDLYVADGLGSPLTGGGRAHGAVVNLRDDSPSVGHFSIIAAHEQQLLGYVLASVGSQATASMRVHAAHARAASGPNAAD